MVNGKIIKCMEKAFLNGQMEEFIKANISKTKSMALELSHGQMVDRMQAIGTKAFSMAVEQLEILTEASKKESGKMERESNDFIFFCFIK